MLALSGTHNGGVLQEYNIVRDAKWKVPAFTETIALEEITSRLQAISFSLSHTHTHKHTSRYTLILAFTVFIVKTFGIKLTTSFFIMWNDLL